MMKEKMMALDTLKDIRYKCIDLEHSSLDMTNETLQGAFSDIRNQYENNYKELYQLVMKNQFMPQERMVEHSEMSQVKSTIQKEM